MIEQKAEKIADCNTENTQNSSHLERHQTPQHPFLNKIIQSTEQIINSQAITIFKLSNEVKILKKQNQALKAKYQSLLRNCGIDDTIKLDDVIEKIGALENQLVQAKMDLAVCKAQNLEIKFREMKNNKNVLVQSVENMRFPQIDKLRGHLLLESKKQKPDQNLNTPEWNKLVDSLLRGFPRVKKFKQKTYDMIKKGIPSTLRQTLWPLIFQNKVGITPNLYTELLTKKQKDQNYSKRVLSQISKKIQISKIKIYEDHLMERHNSIQKQDQQLKLRKFYKPDVSYVQGMTYPVIVLNLIVGKYRAFGIFCNLILGNQFFRRLYAFQENYLSCFCRAFDILLEQKHPKVAKLLIQKSIQSQIYLVEWFFTFFSRGLSYEFTLKIWDYLAYQQQLLFYKLSLSIFELLEPTLLESQQQQPISVIRQFSSYLTEHKLQNVLFNQKLSMEKLEKILDKVMRKQKMG